MNNFRLVCAKQHILRENSGVKKYLGECELPGEVGERPLVQLVWREASG